MSNPSPIPRDRSVLHRALVLTRNSLDRDRPPLSPAEMAWLFAHPTVWLRAVQVIRRDVDRHSREANEKLKELRGPGAPLPDGYAEAKAVYDRGKRARARFMTILDGYAEEVKAIVGPHALHSGDVIDTMTHVAELIDDGDHDAALDLLLTAIEKWSDQGAGLRPTNHLIPTS